MKTNDLNAQDEQGFTALNAAVLDGNIRKAARLIRDGANPNIPDNSGTTPLMNAMACGEVSLVAALIASGADRTLMDSFGDDALKYAEARLAAGEISKTKMDELRKALG